MSNSIHDELDKILPSKEDSQTLDIGNNTLKIEKRFRSPITEYYLNMFKERHKYKYDISPNFDFYIRCYYPRNKLIQKHIDHEKDKLQLVIMLNGLDESLGLHYKLYDRLGSSLAFFGIASILLPTPFHLNRSAKHIKDKTASGNPIIKKPSDALQENPWYLPNNFIQTINEFNYLLKLVKCEFDTIHHDSDFADADIKSITDNDRSFYSMFFENKKLDISILGYSLGGLKALACFKQKPDAIKKCILMNSGGILKRLKLGPPLMDDKIWEKIVDELLSRSGDIEVQREKESFNRSQHAGIVSSILFDEENVFDDQKYEDHVGKIIIFAGGKDRLVEPDSIKRLETKKHGLNILQVADLSHFIIDDPQFNIWYARIINLLVNFLEDSEGESVSRNRCLALFSVFDFLCNNKLIRSLRKTNNIKEIGNVFLQNVPGDREQDFYLIMRSLYAYYKDHHEFIKNINRYKMKKRLFFGQIAVEEGYVKSDYKTIENIILNGNNKSLSGDKLFHEKEILEHQITTIVKNQVKVYLDLIDNHDGLNKYWRKYYKSALEKKLSSV